MFTGADCAEPGIKAWYNTSVVAHSTSDSPGEEYTFQDIIQ
eukprot:gene55203-61647_t